VLYPEAEALPIGEADGAWEIALPPVAIHTIVGVDLDR
jgi:hypothetical protein